jgi:hypothetical protein
VESEACDSAKREVNVCRRSSKRQETFAALRALSQATFHQLDLDDAAPFAQAWREGPHFHLSPLPTPSTRALCLEVESIQTPRGFRIHLAVSKLRPIALFLRGRHVGVSPSNRPWTVDRGHRRSFTEQASRTVVPVYLRRPERCRRSLAEAMTLEWGRCHHFLAGYSVNSSQ